MALLLAIILALMPRFSLASGGSGSGGGSGSVDTIKRYGGTVMGYVGSDPGQVTINSNSGGTITVPTTPFQI
jgi:hypothetical protein